jgi:chromosome segregation ATPase
MIIKRVSLHNFKNYTDVTWDDIGESINVLLGKNGRGKSNLYQGSIFSSSGSLSLLGCIFGRVAGEEERDPQRRCHSLQEKLSQEAVVAVEVLFDNRQRRLASVDSDEVQIRKSIDSQGKIQVELNSRPISFRDFLSLLQCSGFQLNSPINFVMQGKVKQISHMSEAGLFNLFCEIVGTSVYAHARVESEGIITSTVLDEQKSFELLEEFRDRLSEIEIDKDDFFKFEETLKSGNR